MSASVFKINATGAAAIATSATVPTGETYALISITVHFSAAPVASEALTVTLNANAGAAYDTVLYSLDPSSGSTTDIVYQPTYPLALEGGDSIDVAFANTNTNTYGLQITLEQI